MVFQWRSSVNLHNWNTLEDHWKATGKPLEDHWKHTGISPVAFQCTLGSTFQAHWITTGLPLEDHWLRVRAGNSPHKGPVTRKMHPFDDVIMCCSLCQVWWIRIFASKDGTRSWSHIHTRFIDIDHICCLHNIDYVCGQNVNCLLCCVTVNLAHDSASRKNTFWYGKTWSEFCSDRYHWV